MVVTRGQQARTGQPLRERELQARRRRWRKHYRPTDTAHRHRLPDRQRKTEQVTTYVRRRA